MTFFDKLDYLNLTNLHSCNDNVNDMKKKEGSYIDKNGFIVKGNCTCYNCLAACDS